MRNFQQPLLNGLSLVSRSLFAACAVLVALSVLSGDLIGQPVEEGTPSAVKKRINTPLVTASKHIANIEDPTILIEEGQRLLKNGDKELAKECFEAAVERNELNHYENFATTLYGKAIVHELMGEFDRSQAMWREGIENDVVSAYYFLRSFSRDPKASDLRKEAQTRIQKAVEEVKAGGSPHFYTTKKGKKRTLSLLSNEEARQKLEAGESMRYTYIDELDLSQGQFEKRVRCYRCVFGSIKGYGSTFKSTVELARGVVMKDAHFGKKWTGKVNKSKPIEPSTFSGLFMGNTLIFGNLNLDSVEFKEAVANFPLVTVEGEGDLRNTKFRTNAEFRYARFTGLINAKGAEFDESVYFGHSQLGGLDFSRTVVRKNPIYFNSAKFSGPVTFQKCELKRGATFESTVFEGDVRMYLCRVYDRINFSRATFQKSLEFNHMQLTDMDFYGGVVKGNADFSDCVFSGSVRFSLDSLTRRLHLQNVDPLHQLYKLYQGDDDAEANLTEKSQYGVRHVDDLTANMLGEVSFSNTIFQKFVSFEGVQFGIAGTDHRASFYNTQFYGEAHFESTDFYAEADFRTIFGNEISFNKAHFHDTLLLDDANVPGRMSMNGVDLDSAATISFYGARIAGFGVSFRQLRDRETDKHRLFYEQCFHSGTQNEAYWDDPRLADAKWDDVQEIEITDPEQIRARVRQMCIDRTVSEFVVMKDTFSKRSMNEESDWAYWHLRHYKNYASRISAGDILGNVAFVLKWVVFEKGFGWGVHLENLLGTGLIVTLVFMLLLRIFCAEMLVDWDNETIKFKDLPLYAMFIVSFHSFLGRARDWKSKSSPSAWKWFYTAEVIIGIILVTFFIGAYTRTILR